MCPIELQLGVPVFQVGALLAGGTLGALRKCLVLACFVSVPLPGEGCKERLDPRPFAKNHLRNREGLHVFTVSLSASESLVPFGSIS